MEQVVTLTPENLEEHLGDRKMGLIPRNYDTHPSGYCSVAPTFDPGLIIPENEWESRLKDQQQANASLYDLREANYSVLKSLDQNGKGLCWAFSTTKAMMYIRAVMNAPLEILSAWYVAGKIKNWRDEGGWGSASLDFVAKNGVPLMSMCPSYSRQYDTSEVRDNAALYKATEWWDGTESREQNKKIMISAFLLGLPPVLDLNWMGHSMCGCRLVSINPLVVDCDNSWGESSGTRGLYRLEGTKAVPDGLVIPRVSMGG